MHAPHFLGVNLMRKSNIAVEVYKGLKQLGITAPWKRNQTRLTFWKLAGLSLKGTLYPRERGKRLKWTLPLAKQQYSNLEAPSWGPRLEDSDQASNSNTMMKKKKKLDTVCVCDICPGWFTLGWRSLDGTRFWLINAMCLCGGWENWSSKRETAVFWLRWRVVVYQGH